MLICSKVKQWHNVRCTKASPGETGVYIKISTSFLKCTVDMWEALYGERGGLLGKYHDSVNCLLVIPWASLHIFSWFQIRHSWKSVWCYQLFWSDWAIPAWLERKIYRKRFLLNTLCSLCKLTWNVVPAISCVFSQIHQYHT